MRRNPPLRLRWVSLCSPTLRVCIVNVQLHPRADSGSHLLLHGSSRGSPQPVSYRTDRPSTRGIPYRKSALSVSTGCNGCTPGPLALHLDTAYDDADFSSRWRRIKSAFSAALPSTESRSASRRTKGERGIWQRRFWEHVIRDERDLEAHANYIHFNPVKHGYVQRVSDWRHSSFHRYVKEGIYPADWGVGEGPELQVGDV